MRSEGLHSFATMGLKRSIFFAAAIAVASLLPGQAAHSQVALQKAQNVRLSGESLFRELPMGSIKSRGWINDQLQTSLRALAGQQHRFYPLVRDGTFTGGNVTYSTLNEAQPYYWSAAVAAVATTSSPDLQVWVDAMLDYVVGHQRADGFFGPDPYIAWPRWLFLDGAKHYCEAFPLKCPEIVDFMYKYVNYSHALFKKGDTEAAGFEEWSSVRTATYVHLLQWLLEYHPRDEDSQQMLLEDMTLVEQLGNKDLNNTSWDEFFNNFPTGNWGPKTPRRHGVNLAMALKDAPLKWRATGDAKYKSATRQRWDMVYQYHGKPAGHFDADEFLAGKSPHRGAETCQVVENMWSSSISYAVFGENEDADRAERLTFNSLPAAMTADWWGRQYLQQENQVNSVVFSPLNAFFADGNDSNVFGLQTNYPCCTVNHPQGLPRFVSRSFLQGEARHDVDLLHAYFVPSELSTTLERGNKVHILVDSNYPFEDEVHYSIQATAAFNLGLRIPSWCKAARVSQMDGKLAPVQPTSDVHILRIPAGRSTARIALPSEIVATPTPGGRGDRNVAVFKGPVMFALPLNYTLKEVRRDETEPRAVDNWRTRTEKDNYVVAINTSTMHFIDRRDYTTKLPSANQQNLYEGLAPIAVSVEGCQASMELYRKINDGQFIAGFPVGDATCEGPRQQLVLEMYSAAKLRLGTLLTLA